MKKAKFTESQITSAIKAYEAGQDVTQICREYKITRQTFYSWKKKYSGMDAELFASVQGATAREHRVKADVYRSKP